MIFAEGQLLMLVVGERTPKLMRVLSADGEWVKVQRWKRKSRAWTRPQKWADGALRRYVRAACDEDSVILALASVTIDNPFPRAVAP